MSLDTVAEYPEYDPKDFIDPSPKAKKRGRPKGSKNKKDTEPGLVPRKDNVDVKFVYTLPDTDPVPEPGQITTTSWYGEDANDYVTIRLQSEQVPDGLEATVSRYIAVAVSALPNGNASVITNIGSTQPLILVTVEPYLEVRNKFFPVLK